MRRLLSETRSGRASKPHDCHWRASGGIKEERDINRGSSATSASTSCPKSCFAAGSNSSASASEPAGRIFSISGGDTAFRFLDARGIDPVEEIVLEGNRAQAPYLHRGRHEH